MMVSRIPWKLLDLCQLTPICASSPTRVVDKTMVTLKLITTYLMPIYVMQLGNNLASDSDNRRHVEFRQSDISQRVF